LRDSKMTIKKELDLDPKKILIINPFGIGDILFTTPLIRALKENYPGCFIGFWCNERVKAILESNSNIDTIFPLSRGDIKKLYKKSWILGFRSSLKLFFEIKDRKFDTSFDFSLDHRYGLICKLAGIKERIGYNYKNRGRFLTRKTALEGYHGKHAIEYYSSLLDHLGISVKNKNMELPLSEKALKEADDLFGSFGIKDTDLLVGIAPGAGGSWGKDAIYKHWPVLRFAEIADKLMVDFKVKVILLGDNTEVPLAEEIANVCKNKPINLIGKTSLDNLAAVIKKLRLLISNDGGPMHMAVALGVKTVAVFGPVDEKVYGPYPESKDHAVLTAAAECRPCYNNFRLPVCSMNRRCLDGITVAEAYSKVKDLLSVN